MHSVTIQSDDQSKAVAAYTEKPCTAQCRGNCATAFRGIEKEDFKPSATLPMRR